MRIADARIALGMLLTLGLIIAFNSTFRLLEMI